MAFNSAPFLWSWNDSSYIAYRDFRTNRIQVKLVISVNLIFLTKHRRLICTEARSLKPSIRVFCHRLFKGWSSSTFEIGQFMYMYSCRLIVSRLCDNTTVHATTVLEIIKQNIKQALSMLFLKRDRLTLTSSVKHMSEKFYRHPSLLERHSLHRKDIFLREHCKNAIVKP